MSEWDGERELEREREREREKERMVEKDGQSNLTMERDMKK